MSDFGFRFSFGAGDGARTHDLDLGKVALYQLSYARKKDESVIIIPKEGLIFKPRLLIFTFSWCRKEDSNFHRGIPTTT